MFVRSAAWTLGLACIGLLLAGCGDADPESSEAGEWTVQEGTLQLRRNLHVSDNEAFYFGDIRDVAVGAEGRIYVADGESHHVKILSPEGRLIDSLGTRGQGPGEFDRPDQLFFARGDSLYVLGNAHRRLSIFGPDRDFAYRISLQSGRDYLVRIMPRQERSGYFAPYATMALPGEGDEQRDVAVRHVAAGGAAGDTLFTVRPPQVVVERGSNTVRYRQIPFARRPYFAAGPRDQVHYARTDSLTVEIYDAEGALRRVTRIPFEAVPVTEADREQALEGRSKEGRAAVEDEIPSTKPAFDQFLVDDEGRYWFGRPTASPDSTAWWVATPEEKRVLTDTLPSDVRIMTVRNGHAYGRATTEEGAPALVRYDVNSNS